MYNGIFLVVSALLALALAYELKFTQATLYFGRLWSESPDGTGVQDAITPPTSSKMALGLYGAIIVMVVLGFVLFGFFWGGAHVAGFVVLVVLLLRFFPIPTSHFYRIITASMIRRCADYVRDRDQIRAEVMAELLERAGVPVPTEFRQSTDH